MAVKRLLSKRGPIVAVIAFALLVFGAGVRLANTSSRATSQSLAQAHSTIALQNQEIASLHARLDDANQSLARQTERADRLAAENTTLTRKIADLVAPAAVLATPRTVRLVFGDLPKWCPWGTSAPCFVVTQVGGMGTTNFNLEIESPVWGAVETQTFDNHSPAHGFLYGTQSYRLTAARRDTALVLTVAAAD